MNKRILSILKILNDGEFKTGEFLSKKLNCTRATISNALKNVDSYGIEIHKIRGRGYCWKDPISYLDKDLIFNSSSINPDIFSVTVLEEIDSTNNYLLNIFEKNKFSNKSIPVVAAEYQTNGRGRVGRSWHSGFGESLTFSFCWRFEKGISALSGLSLVIGIAVVRVLKFFSISHVNLKWPNDVMCDNQKLAGVLIDLRGEISGPSYAIIGIGINFKLSKIIKSAIEQKATDLSTISSAVFDRNLILGTLLVELRNILLIFSDFGFSHFKQEWISLHAYEGMSVDLILPGGRVIKGTVDGVYDDGSLCLVTATGRNSYHIGDISIRLNNQLNN